MFHLTRDLIPILERQSALLCQAADLFSQIQEALDPAAWKTGFKEIRILEHQGDALLTEFREETARRVSLGTGIRRELTTISMSIDDCLDVLKAYHHARWSRRTS